MAGRRRGTWGLAFVVLLLCEAGAVVGAEEGDRLLAESDFLWDGDGWEVCEGAPDRISHVSKMVKAGDGGPELWHFVAPDKFLGNMRDAVSDPAHSCPPPSCGKHFHTESEHAILLCCV